MARREGVEPSTFGFGDRCSTGLSYRRTRWSAPPESNRPRRGCNPLPSPRGPGAREVAAGAGIEPAHGRVNSSLPFRTWLPSNEKWLGASESNRVSTGQSRDAWPQEPPTKSGASSGSRTRDLLVGNQRLYQLSYTRRMVGPAGLEPAALRLRGENSTIELRTRNCCPAAPRSAHAAAGCTISRCYSLVRDRPPTSRAIRAVADVPHLPAAARRWTRDRVVETRRGRGASSLARPLFPLKGWGFTPRGQAFASGSPGCA